MRHDIKWWWLLFQSWLRNKIVNWLFADEINIMQEDIEKLARVTDDIQDQINDFDYVEMKEFQDEVGRIEQRIDDLDDVNSN